MQALLIYRPRHDEQRWGRCRYQQPCRHIGRFAARNKPGRITLVLKSPCWNPMIANRTGWNVQGIDVWNVYSEQQFRHLLPEPTQYERNYLFVISRQFDRRYVTERRSNI
jgi:hypothetical protein